MILVTVSIAMSFLETSLFVKNVPAWERAVRLSVAACVVAPQL
jgi:hypothetical protein